MFVDILGRAKLKIGINIGCSSDNLSTTASLYAKEGYDALFLPLVYKYTPECEISGMRVLPSAAYIFGEDLEEGKKISVIGIGMSSDPEIPEDWRHMVKTSAQKAGEAVKKIEHLGGCAIVILEDNTTIEYSDMEKLNCAELIEASSMSHELFKALSCECDNKYPSVILLDTTCPNGYIAVDPSSYSINSIMLAIKAKRFYSSEGPELHMTQVSSEKVKIESSVVKKIAYYSSSSAPSVEVTEGDDYIMSEYQIKENDMFLMASIFDSEGKKAFSSTHVIEKII